MPAQLPIPDRYRFEVSQEGELSMIPIRGEGDTELQPLTLTPVELFDLFMELDVHSEFLQRLMAGWDRMFDRLLPNCESYGYTERLAQLERQGS